MSNIGQSMTPIYTAHITTTAKTATVHFKCVSSRGERNWKKMFRNGYISAKIKAEEHMKETLTRMRDPDYYGLANDS